MAEIEKSVIRPTLEEWKTIFEQSKPKKIIINFKKEGERHSSSVETKHLTEVYEALIREEGGTNVDETLRNLRLDEYDILRLKNLGFNSSKEAKWVIDALKNPELDTVILFVDAIDDIESINFVVKGQFNTAQHPVIYDRDRWSISFDSRRNYRVNNIKDVIVEDLQDEYINIFNFDNTERVRVSFIKADSYSIDPSTMETLNFKTNFLPTKTAITNDTSDINDLHEYNNVYIIKPKALNKLLSGKKIKPRIVDDLRRLEEDKHHFENDPTHPDINLINQPLEPIPNYFKENTYQDKLNEVLTPKSVKKITSRLQYEVRLQGRQSREGRGEGKYTGDRDVSRNKPQLGFVLYHIKGHEIYFPKMKETLPLYIVAFYIKKYPYGDERWFPADEQMLFYSESEVNSYVSPKQMSNKDWIKVSKNLIRDTVVGIVSYLKSLKVSYRVKGKLDLDKFTDKVQDKINNNIKDIVENSMFGFLSQTARRGRRMQVKKNLLKSASDLKAMADNIMRTEFGPLKEFKDLNKDEIEKFVDEFKNKYGREYDFENTEFNLKYIFEPLNKNAITNNLESTNSSAKSDLFNKIENLDGDIFQYFSINSEINTGQGQIGIGALVFCYFYKDDKLDKIEGVVASISRYSTSESKNKNTIIIAKKEISIEYPFDDMGVFMYEIVTGSKHNLLFGGGKLNPVRMASTFYQRIIDQFTGFGTLLVNKIKFNDVRNQHVGYIAGRNNYNAMYYYLYTDSDYYGGSEEGQLCIGKIDLMYKGERDNGSSFYFTVNKLDDYPTLQSFKDAFSVGIVATETGSCIHGGNIPKGDNAGIQAMTYLTGSSTDYDKDFTYRNIKDNKERAGLREGLPTDDIALGFTDKHGNRIPPVSGQNTQRAPERLEIHLALVRKYGQEFLNWTDSLVKKVLESEKVKIGGKYISSGTTTGAQFIESESNSAWAHIPEERIRGVARGGVANEAVRKFQQMYNRLPTGRDSDVVEYIENGLGEDSEGDDGRGVPVPLDELRLAIRMFRERHGYIPYPEDDGRMADMLEIIARNPDLLLDEIN